MKYRQLKDWTFEEMKSHRLRSLGEVCRYGETPMFTYDSWPDGDGAWSIDVDPETGVAYTYCRTWDDDGPDMLHVEELP